MLMDRLLMALRAAGEPTRLRLLWLCAEGELTVGELVRILGQSQPRVSRHLKLLCDAGLIDRYREGNRVFYRLNRRDGSPALGRTLVEMMPADSPQARLDRQRLDEVGRDRAHSAAAYFSANAAKWTEIRTLYIDEDEVERALERLLPPGSIGDLLDIGTGTGRILARLGPHVTRAVGVDLSPEMLNIARLALVEARLSNCRVQRADMYKLPMPDGSFDAVTFHQVLHYAADPPAAIAEAARVLRPGGRMVIADFAPHGQQSLATDHAHRWLGLADEDVARWLRAAGLAPAAPVRLTGAPLTVVLWSASKPAGPARSLPESTAESTLAEWPGQTETVR